MFESKINISYPSVLTRVLGAQMNRLIETVLLSIHNICFVLRYKIFCHALLTKGLISLLLSVEGDYFLFNSILLPSYHRSNLRVSICSPL